MTENRSRILLVVSLAAFLAVVSAWAAWPDDDGAADLEPVAAVATNISTTSSTAVPATVADTTGPTLPAPSPMPPITNPVRVRVPAIGLDAAVVSVGLQGDGQMEVPEASDVGWYRLGPPPGADGSAVLAAHVDFAGERGAFFDLRSVPVGAEVFVDGDDTTRRFVVTMRE